MTRSLRRQVALSVFLTAAVAALALHQTATTRAPAAKTSANRADTTPNSGSRRDTTSASLGIQPRKAARYSDVGSASERRRMIVDELRAMGVPNDVLALVALEDYEVEWDRRFESCWGDSAQMERIQLQKDMSKDAAMRAALGAEGFKQWDTKKMLWEAMSTPVDVAPREADAIYALKKKLQQRQFDLDQARMNGAIDRAQAIEGVQAAFDDYNRELKSVLGEERYAKSQQLDDEFVAGNLRYELASVNPSDTQFQALFKADKEWNQALAGLDSRGQDFGQKYRAINDAHDAEYERVLGRDAFHTLREHEDSSYVQMKKYSDLWGLNDAKIDSVYDTMIGYRKAVADYQQQVQALQSQGQNINWPAVNNYLQQLAGQTQQTLQNSVGGDSLTRLQRNGVLRWAGPGFRPVYGAPNPH